MNITSTSTTFASHGGFGEMGMAGGALSGPGALGHGGFQHGNFGHGFGGHGQFGDSQCSGDQHSNLPDIGGALGGMIGAFCNKLLSGLVGLGGMM